MKIQFKKAYTALKSAGVPVYEHVDDRGNFSIDAEAPECQDWADYYAMSPEWEFGVSPALDALLRKHEMYAEWVNPGRLAVYQA